MEEHIIAAEYANPDKTELVYVTRHDGAHRLLRDENPSFWYVVHQRTVLRPFQEGSDLVARAPRQVRATPTITLPAREIAPALSMPALPDRSSDDVTLAALRGRIAELEQRQAKTSELEMFVETEIAAEYAVIVMAPEGAVDPARKRVALEFIEREAGLRGVSVETLCRSLSDARDARNQEIMKRRLERIAGGH